MIKKKVLLCIATCNAVIMLQGASGPSNERTNSQQSLEAVLRGDAEAVRRLVTPLNANQEDAIGATLLHYATGVGNAEVVQALIAAGAQVNKTDMFSCTPLEHAARIGNATIAKILKKAGANCNKKDRYGYSPLHRVIDECNEQAVNILLSIGANPNQKSKGKRPLVWAARTGSISIARLLLNAGALINGKTKRYDSPSGRDKTNALVEAAHKNHIKMVKFLLFNGAYINNQADLDVVDRFDLTRDFRYRIVTPIAIAAAHGYEELVKFLLNVGANARGNPIRYEEETSCISPLCTAAYYGHENIVQLLLEFGSATIGETINGFFPVHYAIKGPKSIETQLDILNLMVEDCRIDVADHDFWYGHNPLLCAIDCDKPAIVLLLLLYEASINSTTCHGEGVLTLAARNTEPVIARVLLQKGADVNKLGPFKCKCTTEPACLENDVTNNPSMPPFIASIFNAHGEPQELMQLFLDAGADIEQSDAEGTTALTWTIREENNILIGFLLKIGAAIGPWPTELTGEKRCLLFNQAKAILPDRAQKIRDSLDRAAEKHGYTCFPNELKKLVETFAGSPITNEALHSTLQKFKPDTDERRATKKQRLQ